MRVLACLDHLRRSAKVILAIALLAAVQADAKPRSSAVRAEFQRLHPCPSTGLKRGACPGWVRDHRVPLCAGGPDVVSNIGWQSVAEAKAKDKIERQQCRK